jgi:hypothetical protein
LERHILLFGEDLLIGTLDKVGLEGDWDFDVDVVGDIVI